MRAKGPFIVRKYQNLAYTDVCIRAPDRQPRVLTVHDGQHNIRKTAAFFASCEDLYQGCKTMLQFQPYINAAMEALFDDRQIPLDKREPILSAILQAFQMTTEAVARADTPVEDIPGEPATSEPAYEELICAFREIRRIVGDGTTKMDMLTPGECQALLEERKGIAGILDSLQPEALKAEPDPDPEHDGDERLRTTS